MKLDPKALCLSCGIILAFVMFATNLLFTIRPGCAFEFLSVFSSICPGYFPGGVSGIAIGTLYGFIGGAIFGLVFGWLYNSLIGR